MKTLSLPHLISTVNSKLDFFKKRSDIVITNLSVNKHITKNTKYGSWYGDAESTIDGKNYKISLQIPNNVIDTITTSSDSHKYNVGIRSVSINSYGKLAILAASIESIGDSEREDMNQQLYDYCKKKKYFKRKKKALPRKINSILCITSPGSTIKGDVISTTGLSEGRVKILNVGSSAKIAKIILNSYNVDIIVLYRGGHQDVAMNMFSEIPILDAIQKSKVPVCVALGHEIDVPFVYAIADQTFATPSSFGKSIAAINDNLSYTRTIKSARRGKFILYLIIIALIIFLLYTQTDLIKLPNFSILTRFL